jgi:hypothetical protein
MRRRFSPRQQRDERRWASEQDTVDMCVDENQTTTTAQPEHDVLTVLVGKFAGSRQGMIWSPAFN